MAADALDRVIWALRRAEVAVQALKEQRLRSLGMAVAHYQSVDTRLLRARPDRSWPAA